MKKLIGVGLLVVAFMFALTAHAFAIPSLLSTVTVDSLWNVAGDDLWGFMQWPFMLAVGIPTAFGLIALAYRLIMRAVSKLRRA